MFSARPNFRNSIFDAIRKRSDALYIGVCALLNFGCRFRSVFLGGPGGGFSGSFLGPDRSLFQDIEKSPGASYISI